MTMRHVTRRTALALAGASATPALAQPPLFTRPLSVVIPYSAGSSTDILGRLLAPGMTAQLGQPVVVENRTGGGGTVGMGYVARSAPDGHTMVLTSASAGPVNRALFRNLNFDPVRDLSLVCLANMSMNALIVAGTNPARSLAALIDAAKRPGAPPLRYFSPGNGTSQHLSAVLLGQLAGVTFEHVPYRGPAEGLTALLAGDVVFGFASLSSIMGMMADGRVRAFGVTGRTRPRALPDLPTLAELGYPRFAEVMVWTGFAVPRATPVPVQQALHDAIGAVIAQPATRERFTQIGIEAVPAMTLAENEAFMEAQLTLWEGLVRSSGATVD